MPQRHGAFSDAVMHVHSLQTLCLKNARVFMVSGDDQKGEW
jgi:hypothetical protein